LGAIAFNRFKASCISFDRLRLPICVNSISTTTHSARTATVPADLAAAFARNARARAFFEKLDSANRFAILYRVQTAKKPETRAERIARFVDLCAKHETIHPRRQSKAASAGPAPRRRKSETALPTKKG
jgi:hypothetical protein